MSILDAVTDAPYGERPEFGPGLLVAVQLTWMALLLGLLALLGAFSVERYYVLSYVGLVVVTGLFAPVESTPRWWQLTKLLVGLGFLGLCYFVATRAADILQL